MILIEFTVILLILLPVERDKNPEKDKENRNKNRKLKFESKTMAGFLKSLGAAGEAYKMLQAIDQDGLGISEDGKTMKYHQI